MNCDMDQPAVTPGQLFSQIRELLWAWDNIVHQCYCQCFVISDHQWIYSVNAVTCLRFPYYLSSVIYHLSSPPTPGAGREGGKRRSETVNLIIGFTEIHVLAKHCLHFSTFQLIHISMCKYGYVYVYILGISCAYLGITWAFLGYILGIS